MTKQIIGLGGGGFMMEENPLLDLYILAAACKNRPKICFLPTASGDNENLIKYFKYTFDQYPCVATYLTLVSPTISKIEKFLLSHDIIYVGGGNTKSMLGLWREWGVDQILKKAYESGIVLAGVSAGFVCWFEQCVTDSIPRKLTSMPCLGLLPDSGCPHYNEENGRRPAYHKLIHNDEIKAGYAAPDGVGLHFIDGKFMRAVSSLEQKSAFYVYKNADNQVVEDEINTIFLGDQNNSDKHIGKQFNSEQIEN